MQLKFFTGGLERPLFLTHAPGDTQRLFIAEQAGQIRAVDAQTGQVQSTPYLDISGPTTVNGVLGLLGFAFHPNFASNGRLFVYHVNLISQTVIAEYRVTGDPLAATSVAADTRRVVLTIDQPQANHNGGWLGFGPDGYLYLASGDGGGADDNEIGHDPELGNGQSLATPLGKVLRIDVDRNDFPGDPTRRYAVPQNNPFVGIDGLDEIWAYGLRNPWRMSFDRDTGDLYIADVGQESREEVNVQPANSLGGENYGWRCREGSLPFNTSNCPDPEVLIDPVHEYDHLGRDCLSITGGYVYRGCAIPALTGWYLYGDFCTGEVRAIQHDGTATTAMLDLTGVLGVGPSNLVSFGEDAAGELYLCELLTGRVQRIVPGTTVDLDANGVQDSCDPGCPADLNQDGILDGGDIRVFVTSYLAGQAAADSNRDGTLDSNDLLVFVMAFLMGC